jgi:GntR family transcriptional regulator
MKSSDTLGAQMAEPMYRMIAQELLDQIESGALQPGDQTPTELALREKYSASRNTIRDALKLLASRDLVETRPGQGTFVKQNVEPFLTSLSRHRDTGLSGIEGEGWVQEVRGRDRIPLATVPLVQVLAAPRYIADRLRVPQGTQILIRRQERHIDRTPFALQSTAYPMDLVRQGADRLLVAEDIPEGTLIYLDKRLGMREIGHRDRILVRPPQEDEARFFRLSDDGRVSVVSVVRTGYRDSSDGPAPFRVTFTVFPADRNQFVINAGDVPKELPGPAEG